MEWSGDGIILGTRRHGETSVILEALIPDRGRHMGIVRGGRSRRLRGVLQAGNRVSLTWRARLEDHLGTYNVEPLEDRASALMDDRQALAGFMVMAAHMRLLPERDAHPELTSVFDATFDMLPGQGAGAAVALFERDLLAELGFGLDLSQCVQTGVRDNLIYVSPKTGRAVCKQAGDPYADRLLAFPALFAPETAQSNLSADGLSDAFRLTGHFLHRHVWSARNLSPPPERERFISLVTRG